MEVGPLNNPSFGTDSQDSDDIQAPGTSQAKSSSNPKDVKAIPMTPKGVEIAKKRLRAFSIQKKSSLSPVSVPKPLSSGSATVFIGKLAGAKASQPKPDPDPTLEQPKKPPKPPKPGARHMQENYINFQKKTLEEIEDMKRKMELVELGIPLGLICPAPNSDKAMPTKAMPPIKSFIAPAKVDELIREAKKAKAEGKEFKFDYQKLLPDYDNPFQRKKDEPQPPPEIKVDDVDVKEKEKRRSDKYESRKYSHKDEKRYKDRDDKYRDSYRDKSKDKRKSLKHSDSRTKDREGDKSKDRDREHRRKESPKPKREEKSVDRESKKSSEKNDQETDVDLKDFLVCDSWFDNDEKSKDSSPEIEEKKTTEEKQLTPEVKSSEGDVPKVDPIPPKDIPQEKIDSPKPKIERLKPVIDAFKFEIDEENDNNESLDLFAEDLPTEHFARVTKAKPLYDSPLRLYDDSKDGADLADDTFLESVINEIKQEEMDDSSQDKALVEYDVSPKDISRGSVTPELNDRAKELHSSHSDYSDGYKSVESGCKSSESGYKSVESKLSADVKAKLPKYTANSLETWSFVLKICQPLLFRHDKNKCYKETRVLPSIWFTENPKLCSCVKDRRIVYEELEMCKMDIVDSIYSSEQTFEWSSPTGRGWYPPLQRCFTGRSSVLPSSEWEAEDSHHARASTPDAELHQEYQRFMEAVWPEVAEKSETPRSTPVRREQKKKLEDDAKDDRKHKKMKLSSEGWSQESEVEEEQDKSTTKKMKVEKPRRKRKHSSSSVSDVSESEAKKRKKSHKKKENKKSKAKDLIKRRKLIKKNIRKLKNKEKKKKKLIKIEDDSDNQGNEKEKKKRDKKLKKKKQQKEKKKAQKKKKSRVKSSSSSSSTSSDSESEQERIKKKKDKKKKKRKQSTDSKEELFDVNILNNIKTERLTDEEKMELSFSPRRKPREIINVKELQNDFVGIQIKKEVEERMEEEKRQEEKIETRSQEDSQQASEKTEGKEPEVDVKEQEEESTPQLPPEESNQSQCSSQESVFSLKDQPPYEKDESHLRPSSQNSNYNFHDVMASNYKTHEKEHGHFETHEEKHGQYDSNQKDYETSEQDGHYKTNEKEHGHYQTHEENSGHYETHDEKHGHGKTEGSHESVEKPHTIEAHQMPRDLDMDNQEYEHGDYEMYEQMAMAYQSDVATQSAWQSSSGRADPCRIETVVRARCGEIKCDWRAGDTPAEKPHRPSRWGLKPGEVNIVLTDGGDYPHDEPVYKIQSIANRTDNTAIGMDSSYDEAYMDTYGASDRLQYGDCFSEAGPHGAGPAALGPDVTGPGAAADPRRAHRVTHTSLDDRIDLALRTTVLGEVAGNTEEKDTPDKGILVTKSLSSSGRGLKRVSFADGYKPGQDSDTEEPPIKKKKKSRRLGCAWPCPATHPDHVPLWDALPPPPPPPSPPPPNVTGPPVHLLRPTVPPPLLHAPHVPRKLDPNGMPAFMPPEPPPGLITF